MTHCFISGWRGLVVVLAFLMITEGAQAEEGKKIAIGTFTHAEMSHWKERSFKKHTRYQLIGRADPLTLQASCKDEASLFYRRISVDLTKTPMLHWSWRVEGVHPSLNETTKAGDDYAARVYVVYTGNSMLPWRAKAINYVWSNRQPVGASWPNAFTDNVIMVATQSGQPAKPEQWQNEVRNVREDFNKLFGVDITSIDSVAVMTDCDNSKLPATGYYRNIWFSAD